MIKYYVIDVEGGDVQKSVSSICEYQDVEMDEVVIIKGSLEQVFTIPQLQEHNGIGMVLLSSSYLTDKVDVDNFVSDGCVMMRDPFDRLFVVDCKKPFYKSSIGPSTKLSNFINFDVGSTALWRIAINLGNIVGPDLTPVNEPEPSNFEVETWVPQDELPDSGE